MGVKSSTFSKLNIRKWLLVKIKWNKMPNKHVVDRYFEAVKAFDIQNDGMGLDYFIPESGNVNVKFKFGVEPNEYIGFF